MDDNEMTLFGSDSSSDISDGRQGQLFGTQEKLSVLRFHVDGVEKWLPDDLFAGYTSIKMVTFSFSKSLIQHLVKQFDSIEIIFGDERIAAKAEEWFLSQMAIGLEVKNLAKSNQDIAEKLRNGKMKLFVTRLGGKTSHEKYYLLSNEESNSYRVVTGSANFSFTAFSGQQKENLAVADGEENYRFFEERYEDTKQFSSDEFRFDKIKKLSKEDLLSNLPAVEQIKEKGTVYIASTPEDKEVDLYITKKEDLDALLKDGGIDLSKLTTRNKSGISLITAKRIISVTKKAKTYGLILKEKEASKPTLIYDREDGKVKLNGNPLIPDDYQENLDGIDKDIEMVLTFFSGFTDPKNLFHGQNIMWDLQKFFASINYIFCSPFISVFRAMTEQATDIKIYNYPLFLFLKGSSSAGKSTLVEFTLHLCFDRYGINVKQRGYGIMRTTSEPETSPMKVLENMTLMKGMPFVIDEMNSDRWRKYSSTFIKSDSVIAEHISPLIMITNDAVRELSQQESKRVIFFNISMQTSRKVNYGRKEPWRKYEPTGELYRVYLSRMEKIIPQLLVSMEDESAKTPDLLAASADTLKSLFFDYFHRKGISDIPQYLNADYSIRFYTQANMEDEKVRFLKMVKEFREDWIIDRKKNRATLDFEQTYLATDFCNRVSDFIPGNSIEVFGRKVSLPLRETEQAFGVKFGSQSILDKIRTFAFKDA